LLKRAKVEARIAELLYEAQQKATTKRAYTINEVTERLALASRIAEEDRMPQAITTAEKAIAEVRGLIMKPTNGDDTTSFKQARSMQDIGRKLLQSMGVAEPDDASIQLAIEANDAFVAELERIRNAAQGPTIDQD
jgi:hypothetical protein